VRILSFLTMLFLVCSCTTKHNKPRSFEKEDNYTTFFSNLNFYSLNDTIFIYARFSECREWVGHKEIIKVYIKDTTYCANYIKYDTDCDKMDRFGILPLEKVTDTIVNITENAESAINKYCHQLIDAKISENPLGNAGNIFLLQNSKETLKISIYDDNKSNVKNFRELVNTLLKKAEL